MFKVEVTQAATISTLSAMKPGDMAIVDPSNPSNPTELQGHLIVRTNAAENPFLDLSDVALSFNENDSLFVDILTPGSKVSISILDPTPAVLTYSVPVPDGMTVLEAMVWVGHFATESIQAVPNGSVILVTAKEGTFNCPTATVIG